MTVRVLDHFTHAISGHASSRFGKVAAKLISPSVRVVLAASALMLFLAMPALCPALETVYDVAIDSARPDYVPKLSDVTMRSLVPRKGVTVDDNALLAAAAFHVTRLDWVYPGTDEAWIATVGAAGLELQPTLNSNVSDAPGLATTNVGRILDVHGVRITGPWMTWPNCYWGCANRREWRSIWLDWATYYAGLGVTSLQHDDPRMNGAALYWHPGTAGGNNVGPGCFCEDCIFQFHQYLEDQGLTQWVDDYPVNQFANTFLCDSEHGPDGSFTILMATRSSAGEFGLAGNGDNGQGAAPRLYLLRQGISYNTLNTTNVATVAGAIEVTAFMHDGNQTAKVYRNGVLAGTSTAAAAVSAFGAGGHLTIPMQANGQNIAGDLAELIIYDRVLNPMELEGVQFYLGNKYGGFGGIPTQPDETDLARNLKLWLDAGTLAASHGDGEPVNTWPAKAGFDAKVPAAMALPNGQTAGAPTFKTGVVNGYPVVRFDGVNDFLTFAWFNMKDYVLNHVTDQNFRYAPAAVRTPFEEFQKQSVRDFFADVRPVLNARAGGYMPISCNGFTPMDPTPMDLFDFGMQELNISYAVPSFFYYRFQMAVAAGSAHIYTPPQPHGLDPITDWDTDYPELRLRTRKAIATSYACGGHMQVPWDHYMPEDQPRYFGDPADYAHLFKMVRDHANLFDDHEDAYVTGYDLTDSRYSGSVPVTLAGGSGQVCATVRVVPQDPSRPAVIHLVEWSDTPQPFTINIQHECFTDGDTQAVAMIFNDAQVDTAYGVTNHGSYTSVAVPPLQTWAMITVIPTPSIVGAYVDMPDSITVDFGQVVEPGSAGDPQHYVLNPALPITAAVPGPQGQTVTLELGEVVDPDQAYALRVSGVQTATGAPFAADWNDVRYRGLWAWPYRRQIMFDLAGLSQPLSAFPVAVIIDSEHFDYSQFQPDGSDVRFQDVQGNDLAHECELWDAAGESVFWVKVPTLDPGQPDTHINMFWGNVQPAPSAGQAAVWDDGYVGVWHLGESLADASGHGNDGVNIGSTLDAAGALGKARRFDGSRKISIADADNLDFADNAFTIEGWINKDALVTGMWLNKGGHWLAGQWEAGWGGTYTGLATLELKSINSANDIVATNTWFYVAFNCDGSTGQWYVNGQPSGPAHNVSTMGPLVNGVPLQIGGRTDGVTGNWFDGKIDEVRVSTVTRSADWIEACFRCGRNELNVFGPVIVRQDLNEDGVVGMTDLALWVDDWLGVSGGPADFNFDGRIDLTDFGGLAESWLSGM